MAGVTGQGGGGGGYTGGNGGNSGTAAGGSGIMCNSGGGGGSYGKDGNMVRIHDTTSQITDSTERDAIDARKDSKDGFVYLKHVNL